MAIVFNCPFCQHGYRLKDELAGKTATCMNCRQKIIIPNGGRALTEEEWLNYANPTAMLKRFEGKVSERKGRLFAAACCRSFWPILSDEPFQRAVDIAERYADGVASESERRAIFDQVIAAGGGENEHANHFSGLTFTPAQLIVALAIRREDEVLSSCTGRMMAGDALATTDTMFRLMEACYAADWFQVHYHQTSGRGAFQRLWRSFRFGLQDFRTSFTGKLSPSLAQSLTEASNLREGVAKDVFGNPFRPIAFAPEWRTDNYLAGEE